MQQLLLGDVASAINGLDALNYDLNSLNDDSGKSYLVAQERSADLPVGQPTKFELVIVRGACPQVRAT
jgi:hypothetical protein